MAEQRLLHDHPGTKKSIVWKYFGFVKTQDGPVNKTTLDMSKAICKLCHKEYANKGNTTNLMAHLNGGHNEELKAQEDVSNPQKKRKVQTTLLQSPATSFVGQLSLGRIAELDESLLKLVVGKCLPVSLVDSVYFKNFVSILDPRYNMPGRKKIITMMNKKKNEMTEKIRETLKTCSDIAITHDGWTSMAQESYQTVTAHYINKEWELKSSVLETKKVTGSHTGEAIAESLRETAKTWGLSSPTAVTDNAANEVKAFNILGWDRFGCYGHRMNLAVKKALEERDVARILAKGRKLVTFFHQSSSATDLLKDKQSLLLGEKERHKLIQDCPTRWNSSLAMMKRLLEQTPAIVAIATDSKAGKGVVEAVRNFSYNFEEQSIVEKLITILDPFEKATTILCADQNPTMAKVLPILMKISMFLKVNTPDSTTIKTVKTVLQDQMDKRSKDKEIIAMACMLNPATKDLPFVSEEERIEFREILRNKMGKKPLTVQIKQEKEDNTERQNSELPHVEGLEPISQDTNNNEIDISVVEVENNSEDTKKSIKLADMEDWLDDVVYVGESQIQTADIIQQEFTNYFALSSTGCLQENDTLLGWWKRNEIFYPRLSVLAKQYLAIPASSVPSERVFSLAGTLVNKKRARLSPENVNTIIFLNRNMVNFW